LNIAVARPASHSGKGWEQCTDLIVNRLASDAAPKVFLLWGAYARAKAPMIAAAGCEHRVLMANHPSPLSARRPPLPFLGCRHFSSANAFLGEHGRGQIEW
jgi:uracil-DNA glycosylase